MHLSIFRICIITFASIMNLVLILFTKLLLSGVEEIREKLEVMNRKDNTVTRDKRWRL